MVHQQPESEMEGGKDKETDQVFKSFHSWSPEGNPTTRIQTWLFTNTDSLSHLCYFVLTWSWIWSLCHKP